MIDIRDDSGKRVLGCVLALALLVPLDGALATGFKVLYTFCSQTGCYDGGNPYAGLFADKKGNLFGTTYNDGLGAAGTVFKLTPKGKEIVLHSFMQTPDGYEPAAGLITDKGNLFGTTTGGGSNGNGTVFEVAPDGTERVLYSFTGGADGASPYSSVLADKKGNLYGMTNLGGTHLAGVVFQVTPDGTETVLYTFTGGADGGYPFGGLIRDQAGDLFGTTSNGGVENDGVVFKLVPPGRGPTVWTEAVLYSFTGKSDGAIPLAGLLADSTGNLYGTTEYGGVSGNGVVFQIAPDGTFQTLYSFAGGIDGSAPLSALIADAAGDLYGTTIGGGAQNHGTVFKLSQSSGNWSEKVLYSFCSQHNCTDGAYPRAGVIAGKNGDLYGTTEAGGDMNCNYYGEGCGVAFRLKK